MGPAAQAVRKKVNLCMKSNRLHRPLQPWSPLARDAPPLWFSGSISPLRVNPLRCDTVTHDCCWRRWPNSCPLGPPASDLALESQKAP